MSKGHLWGHLCRKLSLSFRPEALLLEPRRLGAADAHPRPQRAADLWLGKAPGATGAALGGRGPPTPAGALEV